MPSLTQVQAAAALIYGTGPTCAKDFEAARVVLRKAHDIGFIVGNQGGILRKPAVHITDFVFQDADFFVAHLNTGGVRIGMVGGQCFNIPRGHAWYDRIVEADTRIAAEAQFDELFEALGVL